MDVKIFIFILYFSVNIIAFFISYIHGYIVVENYIFDYTTTNGLLSLLYVITSIICITVIYYLCCIILKRRSKSWSLSGLNKNTKMGFFILSIQLLFILFNCYYGLNVAGVAKDVNIAPALFRYFFVLFNPDILFIFYACKSINERLYKTNSIIYIISTFLRGWSGGLVFLFFIILCRKDKIKITKKNILMILVIVLISPYLMEVKWIVRGKPDTLINALSTLDYVQYIKDIFSFIILRLQQVTNVIYISMHIDHFVNLYSENKILPYWAEVMGIKNIYTHQYPGSYQLANALADSLSKTNVSWSSNPGIVGWSLILFSYSFFQGACFLLFIVLAIICNIYLCSHVGGVVFRRFAYVFCILYLFPGWMGMYINLIFYFLIWICLVRLLKE